MKKTLLTAVLSLTAVITMAVPAKRGQWKTITLTDGTTVRVELRGDEFEHFWQDTNGTRYTETADGWQTADAQAVLAAKKHAAACHTQADRRRAARRRNAAALTGSKKGLIILVDFSNKQFRSGHTQALFSDIANTKGYSDNGFKGSVHDYFTSQSNGQFDLTFDVVGPVRMSQRSTYYGGSDAYGNDEPVDELVKEACQKIDSLVDFTDYDWDGDGEVDQVFILYAGKGQADGGANNTIWPHEYYLSAYEGGSAITLDGVIIDTYACTSELNGTNGLAGIGTICHEFSHCLGLPDLYDTLYGDNFGMNDFSLMDSGNYLGDGMTPPNFTAWERWYCGWVEPIELTDDDITIDGMPSSTDYGTPYVIYNAGNRNEYYLLENRQQTGWDQNLPSHGLMISHVDYDEELWDENVVNGCTKEGDTYETKYGIVNRHQRLTIFHADGEEGTSYYDYTGDYNTTSEAHDLYPYNGLDSLTALSVPTATVYNANSDGSLLMNYGIYNITEAADSTVSFTCRATATSSDQQGTSLLHETFDECAGTGGNSGGFSGTVASAAFKPDMTGWKYTKAYGGDRCARFGNSSTAGFAQTPVFSAATDTMTITFRAAGWQSDTANLLLQIDGEGTFTDNQTNEMNLSMQQGAWTTYTLRFTGKGALSFIFQPSKRFFLDDVDVTRPVSTGIHTAATPHDAVRTGIYNLAGQYVGTSMSGLPHGIYINGGKKVVK